MNWTHARRIAWKDMRRIGALWIVLVGFWIVWLAGIAWMSRTSSNFGAPFSVLQTFTGLIWTVVIYAVAWGGMTFSIEHEEKTYAFLRSLPIRPKSVFYGKLLFGALSVLALALVLAGLGAAYRWVLQDVQLNRLARLVRYDPTTSDLLLFALTVPLSMFVGMFWSMIIKRPMLAIGATAFSLYVLAAGCAMVLAACESIGFISDRDIYSAAPKVNWLVGGSIACSTLFAFAISRWQMFPWLNGRFGSTAKEPKAPAAPTAAISQRPTSGLRRLLWLQRKQSRLALGSIAFAVALIAIALPSAFNRSSHVKDELIPLYIFIAPILASVLGVTAFRSEHKEKRFRLLSQLGANPASYWLSRLLLPGIATVLLGIAACLAIGDEIPANTIIEFLSMMLVFLCLFSISQFCSLAFRSTIIAWSAAFISIVVAAMWYSFCGMVAIPWWIAAVPIIVLPLLASYWRVPRWFRNTNSWRQWAIPAMPILLLALGTPLAAALFRGYEIPQVEVPSVLLEEKKITDKDRESAEAYKQVFAKLPDLDYRNSYYFADGNGYQYRKDSELNDWRTQSEDSDAVIEELVVATQTGTMLSADPIPWNQSSSTSPQIQQHYFMAGDLLLFAARDAVENEDPKLAWKYYAAALRMALHRQNGFIHYNGMFDASILQSAVYRELIPWAMQKDSSPEEINAAALLLEEHRRAQPPVTNFLTAAYQESLEQFRDWPTAIESVESNGPVLHIVARISPWELQRARRLNDLGYQLEVDRAELLADSPTRYWQNMLPPPSLQKRFNQYCSWSYTTIDRGFWFGSEVLDGHEYFRRGTICQLAAIAIRKETGKYPTTLDGIQLGEYELPDDAYYPGSKLQIAEDLVADERLFRKTSGLVIRSARVQDLNANGNNSFSDGVGVARIFLLPEFDDWSREKFMERFNATTRSGRAIEEAMDQYDLYGDEGMDSYGGDGYGPMEPSNVDEGYGGGEGDPASEDVEGEGYGDDGYESEAEGAGLMEYDGESSEAVTGEGYEAGVSEDGRAPADYPFLGTWSIDIERLSKSLTGRRVGSRGVCENTC